MSAIILDCALELASQKVRLFAVRPNSKLPAVDKFSEKATSDPELLTRLFSTTKYNSGIACGKVSEGLYLVGFDIDNKEGRHGYDTLAVLQECGFSLPETWSQRTPSGGEHRLFWSPVPIRQGTDVLGSGIDLRGDGGYLVGPGSTLGGVYYHVLCHLPIAAFPRWAVEKYEKKATVHAIRAVAPTVENQVLALKQSVEYLQSQEPSRQGGRSNDCFKHVARIKDFGLAQSQVHEILLAHWRCEPMLGDEELIFTINNAYHYSKNMAGVAAPENLFSLVTDTEEKPPVTPAPSAGGDTGLTPLDKCPIDLLNENHFYCASNGATRVYWETRRRGKFHLERFPVFAFHEKYLSRTMLHDGKEQPVSQVWLRSPRRRDYDYLRFDPSHKLELNAYNTWRGFAVAPKAEGHTPEAVKAVDLFFEHVNKNVCNGDPKLAKWLTTFMAHIFQRPGEKPEVSLVFQGLKGTGKTIVSEILDHLIGDNSVIIAKKEHALGHFNSIMEDKLLVTLDEAFWSGDKDVEGVLKDLITGRTRVITHKGAESYIAEVYDRVIIIGNEKWLVPASSDERRFAVFKIGEGRRRDREFFGAIKDGLFKHGGDSLLMHRLLKWELSSADVNVAPETEGLNEQKNQSLGVFEQWWFHCLQEGRLMGSGLEEWPDYISANDFYKSFCLQLQEDGVRHFKPSRISTGMLFKHVAKSCAGSHVVAGARKYKFAAIDLARMEWDLHRGFETAWEE